MPFLPTANNVCGLYPFSPERETCCRLSVRATYPFLRRLSALLLQSHRVARSRESDKILADSNPAGICRPMNPQDPHRQQITFAAFILSFQNGKCFERFPSVSFYILIFLSENCLQKFRTSLSAVFSRHSYTQFSNLSFLPIKNLLPQGIYPCGKRFLLAYLISRLSREHP